MSSFAVSVRTVFFECPLRWFLRPAGASLSRWSSSSALRTRSASAFFSSSKSPSLLKTSFGSRPSRSWSRVSFLIAISALRRRHYGPAHKIPDSPSVWSRELDGHEADRHERLAGGAAGLCRQPQPGPSALGESVRPPEQPPAVAEAAVLGGPHHKLRRGRPEREGREDVALAIGDHRDPRRLGPDLRRPPGAVEPAPALLLGQRPRAPRRPAPSVARQEAGVHQSEDRAVALIHRQNRVQIKAAAALRGHDRGVLDRQNRPAGAAPRRPRRRLGAISSTVTAGLRRKRVRRISPARLAPSRRTRTPRPPVSTRRACRNAPLFPGGGRQTAPAKAPSPDPPSSHDRESDIASPLKPKCVNAVALVGRTDSAEGRARR